MKYKVTHMHKKPGQESGYTTEYIIDADSPLRAAKMAHSMHNGCDDFSTGGECRTRFEMLTDNVTEDRDYYKTFISDNKPEERGKRVFVYDDLADHAIWVEWTTPTIMEIIQDTGMTQTAFAKRFDIPLRTIQNWHGGQRECPEYIRKMMIKIIDMEAQNGKS